MWAAENLVKAGVRAICLHACEHYSTPREQRGTLETMRISLEAMMAEIEYGSITRS